MVSGAGGLRSVNTRLPAPGNRLPPPHTPRWWRRRAPAPGCAPPASAPRSPRALQPKGGHGAGGTAAEQAERGGARPGGGCPASASRGPAAGTDMAGPASRRRGRSVPRRLGETRGFRWGFARSGASARWESPQSPAAGGAGLGESGRQAPVSPEVRMCSASEVSASS